MAKNIIEYYKQTAIYHVRYASENDVLYNNSDENKYVNFTYSGVTYAIRNSAIYYDGSAVYFTLISENPNTVYHQYEENNEWHTGSTNPLDQNSNGVYYKTFYKNGNVIYNFSISSSTLDHIVGYDIPYFTDLDAYTAYITNVINDWKNVDWELMDPIKLPSTMRDNYVINYNYDIPIQSGQSWEGFKNYVIPGTMIPVTFGPFVTINFKYGSLIYGADGYGYIAIRDNDGNVISEIRGLLFWLSTTELYLIAGVDEKNKEGRIGLYLRPQSGYGSGVSFNSKSKNKQAYEFITQNLLGATVNVNYYIPEGTYQYAKITYKQNTSPIDQNDGDSVDIDPTLSSVNIKGLEEEKTYWFIIFTDKSESEAFQYTVSRIWDGSEIAILWSGNNNKLTAKIDNSHIVFIFYTSNTVVYTFNSFVGTEVTDIDKINIGFLISNEQHLAKPSFIYNNNGTYSYNQEEPTDEQMGLIYTWLSAGL